jgi:hypothetical protein
MPKYKVLRRHDGDKEYHDGDERTLSKAEAKHLVDLGVLQEIGEDSDPSDENNGERTGGDTETALPVGKAAEEVAKFEAAPANKAEKTSPKNKAAH